MSSTLFVCLFVCQQDYCKNNQPISLKLGVLRLDLLLGRIS